jgi:aspartyl/asparaginyl beta-hydroxylase (cupin superfamily)
MKFFRRLGSGVNVAPLLAEIEACGDAWLHNTSRQDKISVQRHTNTIFLRSAVRRPDLSINENQESCLTQIAGNFPRAIALMAEVARRLNAELSRANIVRLAPHSKVHRHIDTGSYYLIRDRYHFVLHSPTGSVLVSGDEQVRMLPGELWWFDNKQHHWAENESDEWRLHYIFDLLPKAYKPLARNPLYITSDDTPTD